MNKLIPFFYFIGILSGFSQTSLTDFTIETSGCIDQKIRIGNLSTDAVFQEWDFCDSDLLVPPSYSRNTFPLLQAVSPIDLRIKNENGQWYSFVCDGDGNRVIRLSYGNSLSNIPTQSVVGNFQIPTGIDLYKHNGDWYGLVGTFLTPTRLFLLEFGSSLANTPAIKQINIDNSDIIKSRSIRIVSQGNDIVAFIANWEQAQITRVVFGSTFSTNPISVDQIPLSSSFLIGLDALETNDGRKLLYATSYLNDIFSIDFSQDWKGAPIVNVINTGATLITNPTMLDSEFEGGKYFLHLISNSGQFYRFDFDSSPDSQTPAVSDLGNLGGLTNARGFDLVRENGSYTALLSSFSDTNLSKLVFKGTCQADPPTSTLFDPKNVVFKGSGIFSTTLRNFSSSGVEKAKSISVVISNNISPNFSFETTQRCTAAQNSFSVNSDIPLASFSWQFGDGGQSAQSRPLHQFQSSGNYTIRLIASSVTGCGNYFDKKVLIYDPPVPSFTPPSGLICTNNEFTFANTTVDNFDGNLTYQWQVDGQDVSTNRDLEYTFTNIGNKNITLKTSIPGCTSEVIQVLNNVQAGPTVGFNVNGRCQNENISFVNTSSGSIASFAWDFGNSQISNQANPTVVYSAPGYYNVSLQSNGTNGCVSTTSKEVTIYSKPQTDFAIALPPFSCAGTPSQFNDLTPAMTDSNIAAWQWTFGDGANSSAQVKNPTFLYSTAGSYNVGLTTTTNFGCTNSAQKTISILPPPTASFINGLACLNQNLQFSNTSGADIKASQWRILGSTFTTLNPPLQRFTAPGIYPVQLTVTGSNNCQNQVTRNIIIQTPPNLGYTTDAPCTDNATLFANSSIGGTDPIGSIQWDILSETLTGQQVRFTFPTPGIYAVAMRYVGQSGCTYRLNKNVSIINGPQAVFAVSDDVGASPLLVSFSNFSLPSDANYQWTFRREATIVGTATQPSPSFSFSPVGNYSAELTVTTDENCVSKKTLPIRVVVPEISTKLSDFSLVTETDGSRQASVTILNKSNIPIIDPEVMLDVSGGALLKEKIVGKFKPGQEVSQQIGIRLVPRALNYVCAELIVNNDLEPLDNKLCISVSEEPTLFSPFPNPAREAIKFEWISSSTLPATAKIYNSSGRLVFEQTWNDVIRGRNTITIDTQVANMGNALYFMSFQQGETSQTFRVMVAKE